MSATCITPIKGRVIRIQKLDTCGNPVTGAGNVVVADGFIMVHPTPQYEDGVEFVKRRADGALCVNQKDPGQLKRVSIETTFCVMDPDLIVLQTGSREILTSGTGTGVAFNDSLITTRFSLEVWQNITGRNACNAAGQQQYVYWAYPNLGNAQVKDFQIENQAMEWKMSAETMSVGTSWGVYPTGATAPNTLLGGALQTGEHYGYNITTTAPPTASCGAATLS